MTNSIIDKFIKLLVFNLAIITICSIAVSASSDSRPSKEAAVQTDLTTAGSIDNNKVEQFIQQHLDGITTDIRKQELANTNNSPESPNAAMVLDSTQTALWLNDQWVDSTINKYYYNANSEVEYSSSERWVADHWEYIVNSGNSYDENNRLIERIDQDYTNPNFEYVTSKTNFAYDFEGRVIDSTLQYWHTYFNAWEDNTKYSMIYDINGNRIDLLFQIFQYSVEGWEPDYRVISNYNGDNNITQEDYLFWNYDEVTWDSITARTLMTYDNNQNLVDSSTLYRDMDDLVWGPAMTYVYTYDNRHNRIGEAHYYHDDITGELMATWRMTLEYDASNNKTKHLMEFFDGDEWQNILEERSTYTDGKLTETNYRGWSNRQNAWVATLKINYEYNLDGNQTLYHAAHNYNDVWTNVEMRNSYYSELVTSSTEAGSEVETVLTPEVIIFFDSVQSAGASTVVVGGDGPATEDYDIFPPDSSEYYYISTTADYVNQIQICITYQDGVLSEQEEADIRLLHYQGGKWFDITTSINTNTNKVCGSTDGLSPFALGLSKIPTAVAEIISDDLPTDYSLNQNYPNPFNPSTTIIFSLPQSSNVDISIFNILGRKVETLLHEKKPAGSYSISWDGKNATGQAVASGMYFYRLTTDAFTSSKKMLLLK